MLIFGDYGDDPDFTGNFLVKEGNVTKTLNNIVIPFLFVLSTAILPLLLLNLLIAIMSDTYENVMTNIQESDNSQLNSMILHYENFYWWRRFSPFDVFRRT